MHTLTIVGGPGFASLGRRNLDYSRSSRLLIKEIDTLLASSESVASHDHFEPGDKNGYPSPRRAASFSTQFSEILDE